MKTITYCTGIFLAIIFFITNVNGQTGASTDNVSQNHLNKIYQDPHDDSGASGEKSGKGIQVFPNPNSGQFRVSFISSTGGKAGITVSQFQGNAIMVLDMIAVVGLNAIPMDISGYGPGTYTVTVSGAGAFGIAQVIVRQ